VHLDPDILAKVLRQTVVAYRAQDKVEDACAVGAVEPLEALVGVERQRRRDTIVGVQLIVKDRAG
jgi:hypothetical protein